MTAITAETQRKAPVRPLLLAKDHAVLILLAAVVVWLSVASPAFFTSANILNILNQNAPLAIIAAAGTFVIVSGNFDLSTASIFAVASVCAAWLAVETGNPLLALVAAPVVGMVLGALNGLVVASLRIHSFLATLASSMVYSALAVLITGGALITVDVDGFADFGRGSFLGVFIPVWVLAAVVAALWFLLSGTVFGRHVFATGGNAEAAELSGIRADRVKVLVFVLSGLAAGIAAAIAVSRISSGQPQAGAGMELQAIAAIILGGTSIHGGVGAVWRSVAGVFLIALVGNGFDIMNFNPQLKDLVTGLIILAAVALAAVGRRRR
ncbi:ABC transporter permease [Streptomyces marincola]|uniref:ABC transporter permease n=1 Tax=Streptomyces marincola TaxID=2878388 RepID=UPI001CF2D78A|nr:ABC transporter permease [Streptomyces marincola]UCM89714.1 ABC transporter permease [Streptomyces marincola]